MGMDEHNNYTAKAVAAVQQTADGQPYYTDIFNVSPPGSPTPEDAWAALLYETSRAIHKGVVVRPKEEEEDVEESIEQ
jgi:hypothetical protein